MKRISFGLLALSAVMSAAMQAGAVDYVIEGRIDGCDSLMLYAHDYNTRTNIDSAVVVDGSLRIVGSYDDNALVRIEGGRYFSNCVIDTLAVLDFETHWPSDGSELNRRLRDFCAAYGAIDEELGKFSRELDSHGFGGEEKIEIYRRLYKRRRPEFIKLCSDVIAGNDNGVGTSAVMKLGNFWDLEPDEWDSIYVHMPAKLKATDIVTRFNDRFTNMRKTMVGMPFVDFEAQTPEGTQGRLSDYVGKGRWILVDFWASWCGPCRQEAAEVLKPLYAKYGSRDDFGILGVGIWDSPEKLGKAISDLGYEWPQLFDGSTGLMSLYGFDGIPMIILFAPDGTIAGRNLRGDGLVKAVENALGVK